MNISTYIHTYLLETAEIAKRLDQGAVEKVVEILVKVKSQEGRVFFLGVGGGAATGSHAANDFNKIAHIPTICLGDNSALLTALANDEGWGMIFKSQLEMHKLNSRDCIFIYSVGGGTETVSQNIVLAIDYAKTVGAQVLGVVGKDTGATAQKADACIIVPCIDESTRTAHTEDFQLIMNHLLVNIMNQILETNEKA